MATRDYFGDGIEVQMEGDPRDTRELPDEELLAMAEEGDYGSIEGGLSDELLAQYDPDDHNANLAMFLSPSDQMTIARDVIEAFDQDEQSRKPWYDRYRLGLQRVGIIDQKMTEADASGGVPASPDAPQGASMVVHPLLFEAAVQFQARALAELYPSTGPVKATVVGQSDEKTEEQRERVEKHMNYQITTEDKGYFADVDKMLFGLPFAGSAFKKTYFDSVKGHLVGRLIDVDDVVVPYWATSIYDAPRISHRFYESMNDMRKRQQVGEYLADVAISKPGDTTRRSTISDAADGREHSVWEKDDMLEQIEMQIDLDLPGFEDENGIARPYLVTVNKDDQKLLAVRRNWLREDELQRRLDWITHYKYLPGLGFYGYGLFHAIGGLGDAASGTLRALLDSAAFANFQGGYKSKDAKVPGGNVRLIPGVWQDTECTAEELAKAFYTPPFRDPPAAMFNLLGLLVDSGQKFANTTEAMTGAGTSSMPVGTMLARIEQGGKVYSGIHKRLHVAQGEEFQIRSRLNFDTLPDEGMQYNFGGSTLEIFREDYNSRIDIVPVSDPNIFSNTQRVMMGQMMLELSNSAPELYRKEKIHRFILQALNVPTLDEFMRDPDQQKRYDPATEYTIMLTGGGVKAFLEQDHVAHLATHMAQLQMAQTLPPEIAQPFAQRMIAHIAEHNAMLYLMQISAATKVPFAAVFYDDEEDRPELPPDIEQQVAQAVAAASQQVMQQVGGMTMTPQQIQAAMEELAKREQALAQKEAEVKDRDTSVQHREAIAQANDSWTQKFAQLQDRTAQQMAALQDSIDARSKQLDAKERMLENEKIVGAVRNLVTDYTRQAGDLVTGMKAEQKAAGLDKDKGAQKKGANLEKALMDGQAQMLKQVETLVARVTGGK